MLDTMIANDSPRTQGQHHYTLAADRIAHDLAELVADEAVLLRLVTDLATLRSSGRLGTTQEVGALHLGRVQRELALVRAAKRHLQQQARVECLYLCDICGCVIPRPVFGKRWVCADCAGDRS